MRSKGSMAQGLNNHFPHIPARTPGPLGINDHADPNVDALAGTTPGPLGINDHASPILHQNANSDLISSLNVSSDGMVVSRGIRPYSPINLPHSENLRITPYLLKVAEPNNPLEYYYFIAPMFNEYAVRYAVNTRRRLSHFLSQIGHESRFKVVSENGSYSARAMRRVFGCKGGAKNYDAVTDDAKRGRLREKLWSQEQNYAHNSETLLSIRLCLATRKWRRSIR